MSKVTIQNATLAHCEQIYHISKLIYDIPDDLDVNDDSIPVSALRRHVMRFPQGTFVALIEGQVVGFAITMRLRRSPLAAPLSWEDAVGGLEMSKHDPNGEWLYGVDFGVHPDFRRRGIGTKLYRARFKMVKQLNLRGFYAGGMLADYHKYADRMSVQEYGRRVMNDEIKDRTVTMQINRGFKARAVIKNYCGTVTAFDSAMLIVWNNPQYRRLAQAGA